MLKLKTNKNLFKLTTMTSMSALLTACNLNPFLGTSLVHNGTILNDTQTGVGNRYDVFHSSFGADTLTGVYGADFHHANRVNYLPSKAGVTVVLYGKTVGIGGHAQGDVLIEIDDMAGSQFDDHLTGNAFDNEIEGYGGNDIIYGLGGDDILKGGDGDNQLFGGAGDDRFEGGSGANIMNGGSGSDAMSYIDSTAGIDVNLLSGAASGGNADGDTLIDMEYILGSYYDDIIIGNAAANGFTGLAGNDLLDGGSGGDDILYSGSGDDIIISRDGDDDLYGGDGDDELSAGAGNDRLRGGDGDDLLNGGTGNDELYGGFGVDNFIDTGDGTTIISYTIEKNDGKISLSLDGSTDVDLLNSIEFIEITGEYTVDVQDIWGDLATMEQAQFIDETDFLNWLGDNGGYNYEGL